MQSTAQSLMNEYGDDILRALTRNGYQAYQDWENETTIWGFDDDSAIVYTNSEFKVVHPTN
jgi:hypothetical protein